MRWLSHALAVALTLLSAATSAADIFVVVPRPSPLADEFIGQLQGQRPQDRILTRYLNTPELASTDQAELIITMGQASLDWRQRSALKTPTIATYVSTSSLSDQQRNAPQQHIILANPKPDRQLRLAELLLPRAKRAGLMFSPSSQEQLPEWKTAAEKTRLGLETRAIQADSGIAQRLLLLLESSDLLIGIDDSSIYNADNLKTILLTSYSRNKVLIGPSAPFIEAGSLSTTYSTPEDMARSVAKLLAEGTPAGGLSYPAHFSVLSNAQVARSLGLPVPDDAKLGRQLTELEQTP